jgi:hypothetical protein
MDFFSIGTFVVGGTFHYTPARGVTDDPPLPGSTCLFMACYAVAVAEVLGADQGRLTTIRMGATSTTSAR